MNRGELQAGRRAVIDEHGPWLTSNIHLGEGVYTMSPGVVGAAEANVRRIAQLVRDHACRPLAGLRVLDLGAYEGGLSIELALGGAEVMAVEARHPHVAKLRFAAEALGLERVTAVEGDVRDLRALVAGPFDVVLCLGVLYHLDHPDVFRLVRAVAELTASFAVFETQVSLTRAREVTDDGTAYWGRDHAEDPWSAGAAVGTTRSFWLTRPSLLRALGAAGFTSVTEAVHPAIPALAAFRDHVVLVAHRGTPVRVASMPEVNALPDAAWELPERLRPGAHPSQGLRYRVLERLRRARGGGLARVFKGR